VHIGTSITKKRQGCRCIFISPFTSKGLYDRPSMNTAAESTTWDSILHNLNVVDQAQLVEWAETVAEGFPFCAKDHPNYYFYDHCVSRGRNLTLGMEDACAIAAACGNLHVLKLLRSLQIPWGSETCEMAAKYGHIELLKWARKEGCAWCARTCHSAAQYGQLEVLKWARENGCDWYQHLICVDAAEGGDLNVLKWLRGQDCSWHNLVCAYAVKNGFLHMLSWVRQQHLPCPWDQSTSLAAVICGDLATLQWAAFHGCAIDAGSCEHAAKNGHLRVLQFLREHDCQWTQSTCRCAAEYGHIEVLIWARANGCPWQLDECRFQAQKKRHSEVIEWIDKQIIN